jgi:protein O-mannosyl-transferase
MPEKAQPTSHPTAPSLHRAPIGVVLALSIALAALTLLLYQPVRHHSFVHWDDQDYLTANPHVQRGLDSESFRWALTTFHASNWHPITWLSHLLDVSMFGLNARPHHVVSAVIHAINSALVLLVLWRMTGSAWRSSLVAALFALHPMHVESVAWVSERKDLLSAMFGLLTVGAYAQYVRHGDPGAIIKRRVWYAATAVLFALGLMCKPMLVTLPAVLLLLDVWPLKRWQPFSQNSDTSVTARLSTLRGLLLEKLPLITLSIASCVVTYFAQSQGGAVKALSHAPLLTRVGESLLAYGAYLTKLIDPTALSFFYPRPTNVSWFDVASAAALLLGLSCTAWVLRRRVPYLLMGWLFFLGTLVPVIGIVRVGAQFYADRYTYLPYLGLSVALAWAAGDVLMKRGPAIKAIFITGLVLWLGALSLLSSRQIQVWRNSETLFNHALKLDPTNPRALGCLGELAQRRGDKPAALGYYAAAIKSDPTHTPTRVNFAVTLAQSGRLIEARVELERTTQLAPQSSEAHMNLGIVLAQLNQWDRAGACFERAVALAPDDAAAQKNLELFRKLRPAPSQSGP